MAVNLLPGTIDLLKYNVRQLSKSRRSLFEPVFKPNFPFYDPEHYTLLSTPERTGALPEYTGRGVVIAFIDSGFYPHPDLDDRVLVHADATANRIVEGRRYREAADYSWHGQMTSVIAAGDGRTSFGKYRGIASNAQLVLVKVSNRQGHIKEVDILRGLRWLSENYQRFNIRVVNCSVGGDFESFDANHPLHRLIRRLTDAGVTVLAAAGNSGRPVLVPPASAPSALTIGGINDQNSLDRSLWRPYHNNYGVAYDGTRKPEVTTTAVWLPSPILPRSSVAVEARWLAPMLHAQSEATVRDLLRRGHLDLGIPRTAAYRPGPDTFALLQARIHAHKIIDAHYQHVDGTSVSVAVASSIVAQLLEANPGLTPAQIRSVLTSTAKRLPDASTPAQGAGVIDPAKAVKMALALRDVNTTIVTVT